MVKLDSMIQIDDYNALTIYIEKVLGRPIYQFKLSLYNILDNSWSSIYPIDELKSQTTIK